VEAGVDWLVDSFRGEPYLPLDMLADVA
jgi:hypothetical protein